jgi:hypothetical protein
LRALAVALPHGAGGIVPLLGTSAFVVADIGFIGLFVFRGRVSPRRAIYFLLLRQKKVAKEKATLLSASLRFATGNLRCST